MNIKNSKYKNICYLSVVILLIVFLIYINLNNNYNNVEKKDTMITVRAKVIKISFDNTNDIKNVKKDENTPNEYKYQEFQIEILEGKHKSEKYWMRNTFETFDIYNIKVKQFEKILVNIDEDNGGKIINLHIFDKQRDYGLLIITIILFISIILIGGKQGLKSILTLVFTITVIVTVLLPLTLRGYNPLLCTIIIIGIVTIVTLTVISGFSTKTLVAVMGTMCGVIIAGIIAVMVGKEINLTGLANEDVQKLIYFMKYPNLNFQGILFSSILIGSVGAVMDVSMSIASSMNEIVNIHPKIDNKSLIKSGMNIGRDIMGSMSNTLILAYTGSSMELMLLFLASGTEFKEIINLDMVASEVVRAIAGSIGLVFTIPFTVFIAVFLKNKMYKNIK